MRITLLLHEFDRIGSDAYAILWLDREAGKWSREGHAGLQLPEWGTLRADAEGLLICGQHQGLPLMVLDGFAMAAPRGPKRGQSGDAGWCASGADSRARIAGHWRVQCIDDEDKDAEYSLFADDEDDPTRLRHRPIADASRHYGPARSDRANWSHGARHERHPAP